MRTFKPFCLSVLPRAVDTGDRFYLSLNVFAAFDMAAAPRLLLEQSLWRFLPQAAPGFVEAGMPKPRSEYLVFGHAYPHAPTTTGAGAKTGARHHAGVRFAGSEKAFVVHGERRWDGRQVNAAADFERVPLTWSHAYGGPGFAANPSGRGHLGNGGDRADKAAAAKAPLALPQFEDPAHPWHPEAARNRAVGFGPLEIDHPNRTRWQGTYDDDWLKLRSPGMPADFDWRFFQVASDDQQLEQPLAGNEAYEWHHLQPQAPVVRGTLPGVGASAFVRRVGADALEPVPTTLRTVLFFPDLQRIALIWQGVARIADEEMSDLSHLLVAAERLGEPRPAAHYEDVFRARDDREHGVLAALREDELLPAGLDFEPLVSVEGLLSPEPPPDSLAARALDRALRVREAARQEVTGHGLDPAEHAPQADLPMRALPKEIKDLPAFFAELRRETEALATQSRGAVDNMLQALDTQLAGTSYDAALVRAEIDTPLAGPPLPKAPERINAMASLAAFEKGSGVQIGEVADMAVDPKLHAEWHEIDRQALQQYRQQAHRQAPATRAEQRHAKRQQQWVRERLAARQPLAGLDLTGADLRGFDLRGANLDHALLESARLDDAQLDGASLKEAVLAHAQLHHASLRGCDFTRSNLGKADLRLVDAEGARFERAVCHEADFSKARLGQADFSHAQLVGVVFAAARLDGAKLDEALLDQTRLEAASLVGASVQRTVFMKTPLDGADLRRLQGARAVFYGVQLDRVALDDALLTGASFVEGTRLSACSLRGARLERICARGISFAGCDLSGARLDGAMLAHADFSGANLRAASAVGALLMHACLDGADLHDAVLRDALLGSASARGTILSDANLFGADLSRLVLDRATRLDGALVKRARLYPRARGEARS